MTAHVAGALKSAVRLGDRSRIVEARLREGPNSAGDTRDSTSRPARITGLVAVQRAEPTSDLSAVAHEYGEVEGASFYDAVLTGARALPLVEHAAFPIGDEVVTHRRRVSAQISSRTSTP